VAEDPDAADADRIIDAATHGGTILPPGPARCAAADRGRRRVALQQPTAYRWRARRPRARIDAYGAHAALGERWARHPDADLPLRQQTRFPSRGRRQLMLGSRLYYLQTTFGGGVCSPAAGEREPLA
jgi:hypothetical protein